MKDRSASQTIRSTGRPTRAQRRAAERAQQREQKNHPQHARRLPRASIIGGVVTVLAFAAILIYTYTRSTTSESATGLTDAAALNPQPALIATGRPAPDFSLKDASGTTHRLSAQRGHPVLLEFFAVWCPVCHAEAPTIARLTREYEQRGVRVWSILANPYGPDYEVSHYSDLTPVQSQDLNWFATTYDVHHPQLIDPSFATVNAYGISKYPGMYLIDKRGVIRLATSGALRYGALAHALDRVLK